MADVLDTLKVDHPKWQGATRLSEKAIVVFFRTGYYRPLTPEQKAADARIRKAVEALAADRALVGGNLHGNLVYYPPSEVAVNVEHTDEQRAGFIAAAEKALPGWQVTSSWDNQQHGLYGFSVQMQIGEKA